MGYVVSESSLTLAAHSHGSLLILGSRDLNAVRRAISSRLPELPPVVVIALASSAAGDLAASIAAEVAAQIVEPPASVARAWFRGHAQQWRPVDVSNRADRIDRAWLPAELVQATSILAVNGWRKAQS